MQEALEFLLILGGGLFVILLVLVVIIRWVFRVETQIGLLTDIRNQLASINQTLIKNKKSRGEK
jgi:hypothetical protein